MSEVASTKVASPKPVPASPKKVVVEAPTSPKKMGETPTSPVAKSTSTVAKPASVKAASPVPKPASPVKTVPAKREADVEEPVEEEDDEEEEQEEEEQEEEEEEPKKKVSSKKRSKKNHDDDDDFEVSAEVDEDEAAALDKSNIIQGGRRTRGKRIDYSQFGPDKEEDDE